MFAFSEFSLVKQIAAKMYHNYAFCQLQPNRFIYGDSCQFKG